jgi:hypothetical protein
MMSVTASSKQSRTQQGVEMPNSKAKNAARKHRKSRNRWKAKHREGLALAKDKTPKPKKKVSVFERAKAAMETSSLSGASPSAVSNPTERTPRRTASMMTFDELKANKG